MVNSCTGRRGFVRSRIMSASDEYKTKFYIIMIKMEGISNEWADKQSILYYPVKHSSRSRPKGCVSYICCDPDTVVQVLIWVCVTGYWDLSWPKTFEWAEFGLSDKQICNHNFYFQFRTNCKTLQTERRRHIFQFNTANGHTVFTGQIPVQPANQFYGFPIT